MDRKSKIYVAGHRGMVGSAILRRLEAEGYENFVYRTHQELDLTCQADVNAFFAAEKPDYVFMAAAKVGGIWANNTYPADFIYQNLLIQTHIIQAAWETNVKKLLFLGSSCIYPRDCPQPMKEEYLLGGPLEPTNEAYAIAKIAGIQTCRFYHRQHNVNYLSVMPTNLYGPEDNFDLKTSHVLPALIRKFHEAKVCGQSSVTLWGTGTALREFLHVDDMADACVFVMNSVNAQDFENMGISHLNIGTGSDLPISDLAGIIAGIVGYKGRIEYDSSQPDGMPKKQLDVKRLEELGWKPKIPLEDGIAATYEWYRTNFINLRKH